jgi:non-heme chloroperoxidase
MKLPSGSDPALARPVFETAFGNLDHRSRTAVNTQNPDRGPLLLISCQKDHMVPDVATRATFKLYGESTAVTDLKQFPDRGHSLTIDHRWNQVADFVLGWLPADGPRAPLTKMRARFCNLRSVG